MNHEDFRKLVEKKFGNKRGYISAAAIKLNVNQGNLSSMMRGAISIPQKHLDALAALPDYTPPIGIQREFAHLGNGTVKVLTSFTAPMSPASSKYLEIFARMMTPNFAMPDFGASEDATKIFFEKVLRAASLGFCLDAESAARYRAAADMRDKVIAEESRAFRERLSGRKSIVADELTENEIKASAPDDIDADPLS